MVDYIKSCNHKLNFANIKTEDISIHKEFKIYSQDQIEGRYLLTPIFIERFKNLQTAFGSKNVRCAFVDDKIIFAIENKKDLFEIGNLFTSLKNSKSIHEFFEQIVSIYELIEYFKLTQRTGL